jgi:Flp pilus assembly protein TadD
MSDSERIEDLKERVLRDPESLVFAQLAEEYRRAGRADEAVAACRVGLAHHPDYLSARVTLGWALIDLNRLDEAERELERVRTRAPENLSAIRGLEDIVVRRRARPHSSDLASRHIAALQQFLNAIHGLRTQRRP